MIPHPRSPLPSLARNIVPMLIALALLAGCAITFQENAPVIVGFGAVPPNSIAGQNGVQSLVNRPSGR